MSLIDEYNTGLPELNQLEELQFYIKDSPCDNMTYSLENSYEENNSYEYVPLTQWNSQNCIDWGMSVCQKHNFNVFTVDVGRLNNSCGTHLIQSSEEDFCFILGDQFGSIFYREFQQLKRDMFTDIQNRHTNSEEGYGVDHSKYYNDHMGYSPESDAWVANSERYDSSPDDLNSNTYDSSQENYGYSHNHYDPSLDSYISPVLQSGSSDHSHMYQHSEMWNLEDESLENIQITSLDTHLPNGELYHNTEKSPSSEKTRKRSPKKEKQIRNKNPNEVYVSEDTAHKLTEKIPGLSKKERQPKCWEFLMHLLVNPETNPEVVRWEDEHNYVFRLVRKDMIIELWNQKSNFTSHVYDNFARSLRYHYKSSVLLPVPEKQLVYRCGPKAIEYINKIKSC